MAFNFARDRNYCTDNPAKKTAKQKPDTKRAIGILTVDETARLLEKRARADLMAVIAIGAFAGLRRAELERSGLRTKSIGIRARWKSPRREREECATTIRKDPAQPCEMVEASHALRSGDVAPPRFPRTPRRRARSAAGIDEWPQNALRHSFASYNLAHFNDAAGLALELDTRVAISCSNITANSLGRKKRNGIGKSGRRLTGKKSFSLQ